MTIDPSEAANSLQDIATVERRTREAVFYAGSSTIFIMWGMLVACGEPDCRRAPLESREHPRRPGRRRAPVRASRH